MEQARSDDGAILASNVLVRTKPLVRGFAAPETPSEMPCDLQNRMASKLSLLGAIWDCFSACAARNNSCCIISLLRTESAMKVDFSGKFVDASGITNYNVM